MNATAPQSSSPARALVVAGSEASGGAGFQVDLRTFQRLGVFGVGTLTCVVAIDPNDGWAHRFHALPPKVIDEQLETALAVHAPEDLATVKVGMLGTPATIEVVANRLAQREWRNVVVDPVLICKGQEPGAALDTDHAVQEQIVPRATVVTPNLFECQRLSGLETIESLAQLEDAARRIADATGVSYVLAKGGVELGEDEAVDVLWDGATITRFSRPKIGGHRVNGAGCTLAAAITAMLARGEDVPAAIDAAKSFVTAGIEARLHNNTPYNVVWQGAR